MSSLSQVAIILRCMLYVLVRGRARQALRQPKVICIIQTAQLGDMVCTTPVFRAVKQQYPQSKLVVVGTKANEMLIRGNPDVDTYIAWDKGPHAMAQNIKEQKPDFACVVSPNFVGLAALFLAGVPLIAAPTVKSGKCPTETKSYMLLRYFATTISYDFYAYAPREYLKLLEPLGIRTTNTKKYVYYTDEAKQDVNKKLGVFANKPFVVISPSSGNKIKRWPPERFAQVAEYIAQKYMRVVVIGAAPDKEEVAQMMGNISNPNILNLSEQLSVEELKALIAQASLFVGVDTGPQYIAEALEVSTIDIVGPVSEDTQPPRGPKNIVIVPKRAKPQMHIFNARIYDEAEAKRQAEATTTDEVKSAVDKLLTL